MDRSRVNGARSCPSNDAAPEPASTNPFYFFASENCMADKVYNVLFLCTGNSARSILAESLLNHWGRVKFRGFSAGSFPKGQVHPMAIDLLGRMNLPADGLRSKSWDEFAAPGAPPLDFIVTVCDNAAGEVCPVCPGKPMTLHWGIAHPAAAHAPDPRTAPPVPRPFKHLQ